MQSSHVRIALRGRRVRIESVESLLLRERTRRSVSRWLGNPFCAAGQKYSDDILMTRMVRQHCRCKAVTVHDIQVGPMIGKCPHHLEPPVICRQHQGGGARVVPCIYVDAASQQGFESADVALLGAVPEVLCQCVQREWSFD